KRWNRWRPSVAVNQYDDLAVSRFDLIAQDEFQKLSARIKDDIEEISPQTNVVVHDWSIHDPWDFEQVYATLFDFAANYKWQPDRENYYLHITTGTHVAQICLFLLAESRHIPAQLLQASPPKREKRGKHPGSYSLIDLDLSKYDMLAGRFQQQTTDGTVFLKQGIRTRNKRYNALIEQIEFVAESSTDPILITGPTGAGKSQLAKQIFELRKSRNLIDGEYIAVNCATLRGDTSMSTLFGHRKGAFTGASTDRPGLLRAANKGVLFLDEIGELGLDEQATLLHALEEKRFLPLGADKEVASDFQLIAGTNRPLLEDIATGRFREDLLARIDLWSFELPALCKRPEDIPANIDFELERFSSRFGRRVDFNRAGRAKFQAFALEAPWKRNFRDLGNAITRMATMAKSGSIGVKQVDDEILRLKKSWSVPGKYGLVELETVGIEPNELDIFDPIQLAAVLPICRESASMAEAGRVLFATSRKKRRTSNDTDRLRKYLAKFGLTFESIQ
ncbi:MAG: RNA repair transcriptional activator RtcR, partial [Planctomycetes bacterium]|nr:RNA repair transcriptional activator RtcR [Planctomycetota bacterium]